MSQARAGRGTTLKINDVLVAENIDIGAIEPTATTIDVTNHDTTNNGYSEFIGGFKDGGEIEVTGNYVAGDAGQQAFAPVFESGETADFEINYPKRSTESAGPKWEFTAMISKCSPISAANTTDQLKFAMTLKISGKPTFTDAVSTTTTTTTSE